MRMAWFLFLLLLFVNLCFNGFSEPLNKHNHNHNNNKHVRDLPIPPVPVLLVGTVICDTCFHQHLSKSSHFIPGAIVEVECTEEKPSKTIWKQQLKTNKHGNFKVVLPFSVGKNIKRIQNCSVKLTKSNQPLCSVPASPASSPLKLKKSYIKNGVQVFSAGFFSFKPLQIPAFCTVKTLPQFPFPPIIPPVIQPPSFLPPNPLQPAPLVPNPFQPPTPVIPNPFQPPAPVIPNPFQPPSGPKLPLPPFPLPFLTPPPPPPTLFPPSFVPPFLPPLIPIPGIPSGPPRQETSSPIKQSP